jgi:type I restriction enzyme M protein
MSFPVANLIERVTLTLGPDPPLDFNAFLAAIEQDADRHNVKLTAKRQKFLRSP